MTLETSAYPFIEIFTRQIQRAVRARTAHRREQIECAKQPGVPEAEASIEERYGIRGKIVSDFLSRSLANKTL